MVKEKTAYVKVGLFLQEDGQIRITFPDESGRLGIVTVTNNEAPRRGHPKLYECLQNILVREGKWPTDTI